MFYFQGDHLGSSSVVMTQAGTSFYSRQTYFPYGAQRTTEGSALPTDYTFTGQKSDDSTGLMFYGARYYDISLGRFTQPDTMVPSPLNPQSLNRFAYTYNNPVRYTDPTGHMACADECDPGGGGGDPADDPCYPNGCVIEPLPGGGLGEKNNNDGSIIVLPAEPQQLPVAQCGPHAIDCEEAYRAYNTSLTLDSLTFKVAIAGEALGFGGAIAGAVLCTETGPGLVACAIGGYFTGAELAYFTTGLGGATLALVSTGFTAWGDYNAGENRIEEGALHIGQNSVNAFLTTMGGIVSPDPTVDLILAGTQYYVNDLHQIPSSALPPPLRWFAWDGPLVLSWPQ